ncbi:MAG: hypothetical protein K8T90_15215 [Planctomycetes bacterium]|nr:hypothetical protein [Planctomycetota bacterium]
MPHVLTEQQIKYLKELGVPAKASETFEATRRAREIALAQVLGSLPDEETLRGTLDFTVKDRSGKGEIRSVGDDPTKVLESEEASQTQGITMDQKQAIDALLLKHVFPAVDRLLAEKSDDGRSLFSEDDIAEEVFEPLRRRGLFPETLIPDKYSVVQKYIDASLERYRASLEEAREERILSDAKIDLDWRGKGTGTDKLKAFGGMVTRVGDVVTNSVTNSRLLRSIAGGETGTKEERARGLKLAASTATAIKSSVTLGLTAERYGSGQLQASIERQDRTGDWNTRLDTGDQARITSKEDEAVYVNSFGKALVMVMGKDAAAKSALGLEATYQSIMGLMDAVPGVISRILEAKGFAADEAKKIEQAALMAQWETAAKKAVAGVPGTVDEAIGNALESLAPGAALAFAGAYVDAVDWGVLDDVVRSKEPDGGALAAEFAAAFGRACDSVRPEGDAGAALAQFGKGMEKSFLSAVGASDLNLAIEYESDAERKPGAAAEMLLKAAIDAVSAAASGSDGKALAKAFAEDPSAMEALRKTTEAKEQSELLDAMDLAESEARSFENRLTLVDDSGEMLAQQNAIERLIAETRQETKILAFVAGSVGTLTGLASTGVTISKSAVATVQGGVTEVTKTLAQEVLPALKLAKLVVKFSVNVYRAGRRIQLLAAFRVQYKRAKKAGSPLSTSVQGFFESKEEQVAHHMVQDALIAVQIAGTIMELTGFPPVVAAGKLVSVVGSASESLEDLAYDIADEAKLRKGWNVTREAFRNPKNRRNALEALKMNGTLAMHGIAWAAKEKGDPVAIEFLKACGLNERSLALDSATERKIREFLTAKLNEDRVFLDPEKIATNWAPQPTEVTAAYWVRLTSRAETKAVPKLRKSPAPAVMAGLKLVAKDRATYGEFVAAKADDRALALTANQPSAEEIRAAHGRSKQLAESLAAYRPVAETGAPHDEMDLAVAGLGSLVDDWTDSIAVVLAAAPKPPEPPKDVPPTTQPEGTGGLRTGNRRRAPAMTSRTPPKMEKDTK